MTQILETAVVLGDIHAPYHDPAALNVVYSLLREIQPDLLAVNGDAIDFYPLSRFNPDPRRRLELQAEINSARTILRRLREVCPDSRMVYKIGNHEARLRKWASNNPEIGTLDCTQLGSLLGLEEIECEIIEETRRFSWNGWTITHGDMARKRSGYTAHGFIERFGTNGINSHCHRLALVEKTDAQERFCWIEAGCLCLLQPEYSEVADWQHGVVVLNKTAHGIWPELVRIERGEAWMWGEIYTANERI